ncbi:MAG: ribosome-associated translation inhibitor RaiA [Candidatus Falkowbacteria bacterium]|nr:ribosome-associated translation inhibitor RaiA [Candidatus Falkowbacteria bacterium]
MNFQLKITGIELNDKSRNYLEEKMNMLDKFLGSEHIYSCNVEVGVQSHHHNKGEIFFTKVNLELKGEFIRVEKVEADLLKSIDKVKDHLAESIIKYKDKKREKKI